MPLFDAAWAQLGAVGILAFVVVLIVTGRLIPLSTHRREVAAADQRAADWKESWQLERAAREIQAQKDDEILMLLRSLTARAPREPAA